MTIFTRCNVVVNYGSKTHLNVLEKGFNQIVMSVAEMMFGVLSLMHISDVSDTQLRGLCSVVFLI